MQDLLSASSARRAALYGFAAVGFTALVAAGIWLAIYSSRFVPDTVGSLGAAAVSLTQLFSQEQSPTLSVIQPSSGEVISFDTSPATSTGISPIEKSQNKVTAQSAASVRGKETTSVVELTPKTAAALSGLPDLLLRIDGVGYLASSTSDSFVATTTAPSGNRTAVKFTVKNIGTNVAGPWRFSATIPTQSSYLYQSALQQPLSPGDSIQYTLGFDQANRGANQPVSLTANFDRIISESNSANNSATTSITILGS